MEYPPEEVCWVQPTDSLAFSVSPVGHSTTNTQAGEENESGDLGLDLCPAASSRGEHSEGRNITDDDDDHPLVGEFIWSDADDQRERSDDDVDGGYGDAMMLDATDGSPYPQDQDDFLHHRRARRRMMGHQADNAEDLDSQDPEIETKDLSFLGPPPVGDLVRYRHDENGEGDGRSLESGGARDAGDNNGAHEIGDAGAGHRAQEIYRGHGEGGRGDHDEHARHDGEYADNFNLHEEVWIEEDEVGDFVEELAPAWDQGRPAHTHEQLDEQQRRTNSLGDFRLSPPRRQNQQSRQASGFHVVGSNGGCVDETIELSLDEGAPPPPRPIRRRTRSSLDRERRKLDRLPRSQRLSQVKGHPLGGMTLLELEERHLLDVGIGQMTRLLAQRHKRRRRRADADLLRRSARLFRRAREEREAHLSFKDEQDSQRHGSHNNSRASLGDACFARGGEGISAEGRGRREERRPSSASRERSRAKLSSLSLESEETTGWAHAADGSLGCIHTTSECATRGNSPMGLYSGGGAKCSLRQQRPMSAKPALTCGSGWEPSRTRTRCRHRGQRDVSSTRGARFGRRAAIGGVGAVDDSNESDLSDLSPYGIVEYDDEEEGPFNHVTPPRAFCSLYVPLPTDSEDELEQVAASYLLRPRGSFRRASPVEDDRFADDGSVYIYREGDSMEHDENDDHKGGRTGRDRSDQYHDGDDNDHLWREGYDSDGSPQARPGEQNDSWRDTSDTSKAFDRRNRSDTRGEGGGEQGGGGGEGGGGGGEGGNWAICESSNTNPNGSEVFGTFRGGVAPAIVDKEGGTAEAKACTPTLHDGGGDIAAGVNRNDGVRATGERWQRAESVDGRQRRDEARGTDDSKSRRADVLSAGRTKNLDDGDEVGEGDSCLGGYKGRIGEPPVDTLVPPAPAVSRYPNALENDEVRREGGDEDTNKLRQMAARLRQMILNRQTSAGRSIRQVFGHFDRRGCGYVNANEMKEALTDLRLNPSARETQELLRMMAVDGGDRVSYAEFAVFVTDPHHSRLQAEVCHQAAAHLEVLGRRVFHLDEAFRRSAVRWSPTTVDSGSAAASRSDTGLERARTNSRGGSAFGRTNGNLGTGRGAKFFEERQVVSATEFLAGLETLGLRLSATDAERLLVRFDVHGDGYLSAGRFVSMVENSQPWTRSLARLARQEEADEEADAYLRARQVPGRASSGKQLRTEIVEMARYLGIRVSSDAALLWIVEEALVAPLPDGWVVHETRGRKWFYRNELTGQSTWDHPLDPYFRRLYLQARFGADHDASESDGGAPHEPTESSPGVGSSSLERRAAPGGQRGGTEPPTSLPKMLPPRRMRPNVRDFSSGKALESLRIRRLNRGEVDGSNEANQSEMYEMEARHSADRDWHHRELWTNNYTGKTNPVGPRRRRPVSASALRESLEEKDEVSKAAGNPLVGRSGGGRSESTATLEIVHGELRADLGGTTAPGGGAAIRLRRPRSAISALQRPRMDPQSVGEHRTERQDDSRRQLLRSTGNGDFTEPSHQAPQMEHGDKQWDSKQHAEVGSGTDGKEHRGSNRSGFGGPHPRGGPARGGEELRGTTPMGGQTARSDGDAFDLYRAAAVERDWLLDRLADLCQRLDDTEDISGGQTQRVYDIPRAHGSTAHKVRPIRSGSDLLRKDEASPGGVGRRVGERGERGELRKDQDRGRERRVSTGTVPHHQVVELENRIYDLEIQLRSANHECQPHHQPRYSHHHHQHHLQRYPQSVSSSRGRESDGTAGNPEEIRRDGRRRDREGRVISRQNEYDDEADDIARSAVTGGRLERARSGGPSERWSYHGSGGGEEQSGGRGRGVVYGNSSSETLMFAAEAHEERKGAPRTRARGGVKAIVSDTKKPRGGVRDVTRRGSGMGSGNPPGIVLI